MKNILITLLALVGVAAAETVVFDFGRTDVEDYKTSGAIVIGTGSVAYADAITSNGDLVAITGNYAYTQAASGYNYKNSATLNHGAENPDTDWKEHLNAVPAGWGSITLTISGTNFDTSNTTWGSYDIAGARSYSAQSVDTYTTTLTNGTADEGYTYDVSKIFVEDGGSLILTLTGNTTAGNRTPLNGIKVTYTVPEPATATLSLLALCGLAARRRRK